MTDGLFSFMGDSFGSGVVDSGSRPLLQERSAVASGCSGTRLCHRRNGMSHGLIVDGSAVMQRQESGAEFGERLGRPDKQRTLGGQPVGQTQKEAAPGRRGEVIATCDRRLRRIVQGCQTAQAGSGVRTPPASAAHRAHASRRLVGRSTWLTGWVSSPAGFRTCCTGRRWHNKSLRRRCRSQGC